MDIVSHGLWGGVAFGRKARKNFWLAFAFGVAPDLFSFGIFFVQRIFTSGIDMSHSGPPDIASIPSYVNSFYNVTHSLVVFTIVFGLVWFLLKRPVIEMLAWPLHIVVDIFTHSSAFFPTPFLWPISDFKFSGISWGNPIIFIPNLTLLVIAYVWFYRTQRRKKE